MARKSVKKRKAFNRKALLHRWLPKQRFTKTKGKPGCCLTCDKPYDIVVNEDTRELTATYSCRCIEERWRWEHDRPDPPPIIHATLSGPRQRE